MGAMEKELAAVKALFDEALEIAAPAERMAFLDRARADAQDLPLKVEALLRAYEDAGGFMQDPLPVFAGKKDESLTERRPAACLSRRTNNVRLAARAYRFGVTSDFR
jgi:hypothetical protein